MIETKNFAKVFDNLFYLQFYLTVICFTIIPTMERLDQGHLHPKLEVPRMTCLGQESNLGLSSGGMRAL
jgi:hypothetical protein